jgi:hypothetical protein
VKWLPALVLLALALPLTAQARPGTRAIRFSYRAHDGVRRPAWLLLPSSYDGARFRS